MSARYEFIDGEKACLTERGTVKYTMVKMCAWMEVSTSGFYEWLSRPASATARRRGHLALLIEKAFTDSDGTYGYRRLHAQLARWDEHCTPELVRALMRALGLVACQPRPWRHSLTEAGPCGPIPDLVARDFTAAAPGIKMVGDIKCRRRHLMSYADLRTMPTTLAMTQVIRGVEVRKVGIVA